MVMKEITAWTYDESCINAKRIYSESLVLDWICPECRSKIESKFNEVPLVSYGSYCHSFYCHECGFESKEKMYKLHEIKNSSVILSFSNLYNLKPSESVMVKKTL